MDDPSALSDDQILAALERFARDERERLPWFIACLGEGDRRKVFEDRGYSSTFDYCVRRLKPREDEACRRIQAARASVSRPELLSSMAGGHLTLTAVSRLAPHVRRKDAPEIIARAEGKSMREVDALLAPLCPEPVRRDRVRSIAVAMPVENGNGIPASRARVEFSFQGSLELRDAIERAEELLSNKFPFGGISDVLSEVVRDYLRRHDPQKALDFVGTAPAKGRSTIPTAVRRVVWSRDGGRCSFMGPGGIRCGSRRMIGIDHRKPRALGGTDRIENLRLLCRPHNDAERRRLLGEGELFTGPFRDGSGDNSV
ncbi:MAG TPA: HNH endonuclease signature motif containing protein [Elusimicrobiota bacterium]|jgi:5-methylcytosine-specific restriction endonuclease McrA|nr:HNH endonuclease signature motif containing protein [Elusimicrobiota bacterium]